MAGYVGAYDARNMEHETTRKQKQAWSQQQAAAQQQQQANWNQGREMFERGLLGQEQARKQYDSQTARDIGGQKYQVLGGLLKGLVGGGGMGGYGDGMGFQRTIRQG